MADLSTLSRRAAARIRAGVIAFDVVAALALLAVMTICVLHTSQAVSDDNSLDSNLMALWGIWGLIPAIALTVGAFAGLPYLTANERG